MRYCKIKRKPTSKLLASGDAEGFFIFELKTFIKFLFIVVTVLGLAMHCPAYAAPPAVGAITPAGGSSSPNTAVTFTTTYTDPDGWQNIQYVNLLVNTAPSANCCCFCYNQNTGKLFIMNNSSTSAYGGYAPGSSYVIENSYVKLDCSKTTVSGSGTILTVNWNITFQSTFASAATRNTYLYVKDDSNAYQGWIQKGTWLIQEGPPAATITEPADEAVINAEP